MLSSAISVCTHVASLCDDTSRLLFTWAIAHSDEFGRLSADPRRFRALVCPNHELSVSRLSEYFAEWARQRLIRVYNAEGQPYMELRSFAKYNANLLRSSAGRSRGIPAPPGRRTRPEPLAGEAGDLRDNDAQSRAKSRRDAQCATNRLEGSRSQQKVGEESVTQQKVAEGNAGGGRVAPPAARRPPTDDPTVKALDLLAASECITLSGTAAAEVFLSVQRQLKPDALLLEVSKFLAQLESKGERVEGGKAKLALLRWLEQAVKYREKSPGR